ncbi:hypothetical protein [Psychrobacter aestuarii]|uniref:EpsG family protein n=1 Tax=Psychrobacter aestuarii TaxID=556327 RepID=A0ABN0VZY9_9GAMM|nr:hypothetical protein [Psychrobacter aestuarii]
MLSIGLDFYQGMLAFIYLFVSYTLVYAVGCQKKHDVAKVTALFVWHTLFSVVYCYYTFTGGGDAVQYYLHSLASHKIELYPGSPFVKAFTTISSKGLDANYLNATLQYNAVGTMGLVLLYLSIKKYLIELPNYWLFILFIPSMSFWSSGLGKDAISFFAVCLFLYALVASKRAVILLPLSFFLVFMVRPHIAAMMLISYVIYFIIQARVHVTFKLIILPVIAVALFFSINFVQSYVGIEDASIDSVSSYIDRRQGLNQGGGSSLDIASMSYPMQMFTYVFRPLPFDVHNIVSLVTSLENTVLLFLFVYILLKIKFKLKTLLQGKHLWLFTYAFLTCTILALTTPNLGIATRQKWMFMPILIYLLIFAFYQNKMNNRARAV